MLGCAIGGGEKRKEDAGKKGREDEGRADEWDQVVARERRAKRVQRCGRGWLTCGPAAQREKGSGAAGAESRADQGAGLGCGAEGRAGRCGAAAGGPRWWAAEQIRPSSAERAGAPAGRAEQAGRGKREGGAGPSGSEVGPK